MQVKYSRTGCEKRHKLSELRTDLNITKLEQDKIGRNGANYFLYKQFFEIEKGSDLFHCLFVSQFRLVSVDFILPRHRTVFLVKCFLGMFAPAHVEKKSFM